MAKIQILKLNGRKFGYKVGISSIGVKEYFDTAKAIQKKITDLEGQKEEFEEGLGVGEFSDDHEERLAKRLDRLYRRLRAVESRQWVPMQSFVVDRPDDAVNLKTFVTGRILARIEGDDEQGRIREGIKGAS